ncbi:MAG: hypothetical protein ACREV2_02350 [Burkholderiales bacterium]
MNLYWGEESAWKNIGYTTEKDLFGFPRKEPNEIVVEGFRERLKKVAGFEFVSEPLPMRNTQGATVYYLFFASQKPVAQNIVKSIFKKYRDR